MLLNKTMQNIYYAEHILPAKITQHSSKFKNKYLLIFFGNAATT